MKFSHGNSGRVWSHRKGTMALVMWTDLKNIYWLDEFAEHIKEL